jgi:hypothetical protein
MREGAQMASSSVIGALRVVLGLDTASFESGLKKTEQQAATSSTKIGGAVAAITVAASAALVGFGAAILSSIDKLDKIGKAAEKAGIPIGDFSVIASAASKAGVDLDTLTAGIVKLDRALSEAGSGKLTGAASNAFAALGISARESTGRLTGAASAIEQLADKFASFKDSPEKTALAIALFGRAGAEMIPFLNRGGDAIRKQREEMESLGLVMTETTKNKVREFNEAWGKLGRVFDSLITSIAIQLTPAMSDVAVSLAAIAKDAKTTADIGTTLGDVFKFVSYEATLFSLQAKQIYQDILGLAEVAKLAAAPISALFNTVVALGKDIYEIYTGVSKAFRDAIGTMYESAKNFLAPVVDFFTKISTSISGLNDLASPALFKTIADGIASMGNAAKSALSPVSSVLSTIATAAASQFKNTAEALTGLSASWDSAIKAGEKWAQVTADSATNNKAIAESLKGWWADPKKGVEDYTTAVLALGKELLSMQAFKLDAPKLPTESIQKAIQDVTFKADELKQKFKQFPEGFAALARGIDPLVNLKNGVSGLSGEMQKLSVAQANFNVAQAQQNVLTPWEKDAQDLDKLSVSLAAAGITGAAASDLMVKSAEKMQSSWKNATSSIVNDLAGGLANLASVNKEFATAAKIAAYAQAVWNTYLAATKALASFPPPYSYIAAGAAVVAGLGYVAKIQAQGFAQGGSFKVGGGQGGVDSKLVQFMATPGEMVSVKTPGQQGGSESSGGGAVQTIMLQARRMTDMMTLDDLRTLTERLNSANRDGYKLKFAS